MIVDPQKLGERLAELIPHVDFDARDEVEHIAQTCEGELDLNDPATENLVADAIRRLAPEGAYVSLLQRYPWRFSEPTAGQQETTLVDAVVEALRGSAAVLEADRLPHLVPALIALAEALEHGALVPGPPPGPCEGMLQSTIVAPDGTRLPDVHFCELRAGHAGLHEETSPGIGGRGARWSDPIDLEPLDETPAPDWDEEHSHLIVEDDEGKPFLSGCDCEIGRDHYATEAKA